MSLSIFFIRVGFLKYVILSSVSKKIICFIISQNLQSNIWRVNDNHPFQISHFNKNGYNISPFSIKLAIEFCSIVFIMFK